MLYKRGQIWWYKFMHQGVLHRDSCKTRSKTEARRVEVAARAAVSVGIDAPAKTERHTFRDAMTAWWEDVGRKHKSWETTSFQLEVVERVFPMDIDVMQITTGVIDEAIAKRAKETTHNGRHPANATLNREIYSNVRRILTWFEIRKNLRLNRIDWKKLKRPEKRKTREFTEKEIQALLKALHPKYHQMWAFYATYGVRMSEAYVRPDQIDVDGMRVFVRERKDGSWLTVPLLEEDVDWIKPLVEQATELGMESIWFLWRPYLKIWKVIPAATFQSAMKRAYKTAGIKDARAVHDWRHHAATQLVRNIGNLKAAQQLLGHSSLSMTERYAHAVEDDVRRGLVSAKSSRVVTKLGTMGEIAKKEEGSDMK